MTPSNHGQLHLKPSQPSIWSQVQHFPFPELCISDHERKSLDSLFEFLYYNVFGQDKDVNFVNYRLSHEVVLLKTSKGFEGKYIDYVSSVTSKRILAVGPLVTDVDPTEEESSEILQWLSKKEQNSTVYISFGSEYFLSKLEREETAKGVEISEANFIWIIRFPVMDETAECLWQICCKNERKE